MKTLLIFLAIVLIAAGWAVGLINIFSPGTVTVGLNLDVAATLFTGGCVLLGLAVVAGNLSAMTRRQPDDAAAEDYAPAPAAESDLPDFMAPASAAAAGATAGVVAGASALGDSAKDTADASADIADDILDDIRTEVKPVAESAGSIFSSVTGKAAEAADEAVDKAEEMAGDAADTVEEVTSDTVGKARDDLSSFFSKPADTSTAPEVAPRPAFSATPDVKPEAVVAEEAEDEAEAKPETPETSMDADTGSTSIFAGAPPVKAGDGDTDAIPAASVVTSAPTADDAPLAVPVDEDAAAGATAGAHEAEAETQPAAETAPAAETQPAAETAPADAESAPEALPQEDELFVVEERVIRERPARLLSDGTVEAETDEGWMRFENVEHVEEYLDAMRATA